MSSNYLRWEKPLTSRQAEAYLMTKGFIAAELYEATERRNAALTADLAAVKAERDALLAINRESTVASDNIRRMQESLSLGQVKTDNIGD